MAVDEPALLGVREERDGARDVVRGSETPHRNAAHDVFVGVSATGLIFDVHLGLDPARADGVNPHTAPTPLRREGSREPYKPVLASVVRRPLRHPQEPRDGADVHYAP